MADNDWTLDDAITHLELEDKRSITLINPQGGTPIGWRSWDIPESNCVDRSVSAPVLFSFGTLKVNSVNDFY